MFSNLIANEAEAWIRTWPFWGLHSAQSPALSFLAQLAHEQNRDVPNVPNGAGPKGEFELASWSVSYSTPSYHMPALPPYLGIRGGGCTP